MSPVTPKSSPKSKPAAAFFPSPEMVEIRRGREVVIGRVR